MSGTRERVEGLVYLGTSQGYLAHKEAHTPYGPAPICSHMVVPGGRPDPRGQNDPEGWEGGTQSVCLHQSPLTFSGRLGSLPTQKEGSQK